MNCNCPLVEIVCFGEALIDLISMEKGVSLTEARTFEKAPGGTPTNLAVGLARLGVSSGFMGKVGDEDFGFALFPGGTHRFGLRFGKGKWRARFHVLPPRQRRYAYPP